jgi:hypothetical protein
VHGHPLGLDVGETAAPELVVSEHGEEVARARELGQLRRRDCAAACRDRPGVAGVRDLARGRDTLDVGELDVLDVTDDRDLGSG